MIPLWQDEPDDRRSFDAGPWLLCLDLQRELATAGRPLHTAGVEARVERCGELLAHARASGWPVIHAHRRHDSGLFSSGGGFCRPIEGLEPLAREALFFRPQLSAFAAPGMMRLVPPEPGTRIVLAALALDNGCIATVLQAADLGMKVTIADDVLGAPALGSYAPGVVMGLAKRLIAPFARFDSVQTIRRRDRASHHAQSQIFAYGGNETWPA